MIPDRWCRGVRAALFAAVCVLLTATGHVLMSGASVSWWAAAVALAATGGAAWGLAGRERGLPSVTAATVAAQAVLHTFFSLAQASAAPRLPAGTALPAVQAGRTGHTGHAAMGHDHMAHTPMPGHDMGDMSTTGMFAAHLLAALLCGLWLAHGERAAFRVLRALASRLLAPFRPAGRLPAPPHRPRVRARREPRARRLRQLLLAHVLVSRGPPPAVAVL
ncbi:hypothetical protein M5362_11685 [Streptomyces sp. Je 1-79]|uniref:hypothetical protein n=1 Tax=Streptomyces sp. Je 1-79 TaxID=2943847 RepID=UPI0021A62C06|nr:hypothetical protein [Streptomyces sp. Je 1-79]MCT4353789.1 hypothetical protein [Streptomyces sp. Je 1-79]